MRLQVKPKSHFPGPSWPISHTGVAVTLQGMSPGLAMDNESALSRTTPDEPQTKPDEARTSHGRRTSTNDNCPQKLDIAK